MAVVPGLVLPGVLIASPPPIANDEPDQLSWELCSMDRTLIRDFLEWAAANPPPSGKKPPIPEAFPCTWIKAGELLTDNAQWRPEQVGNTPVLRGPGGHNFSDRGNTYIEIAEEGLYRLWVRYRHAKGKNETFTLTVYSASKEDVSVPDIASKCTLFDQTFARSYWRRTADPIPDISTVEPPPSGFLWEGSQKMARMQKGRYRLKFSGGIYPNRPDINISDIVFTSDPLHVPSDAEIPPRTLSQARPPCAELATHWPIYCSRPGATMFHAATPEMKKYWGHWRKQLLEKLSQREYSDYVWGYLASRVYFDEESNLIGRPAEVRKQKEMDARYGMTFKINGREFQNADPGSESWKYSGFYSGNAPGNIVGPGYPSEDTAVHELDIPAEGRYAIWVQQYHNSGYRNGPVSVRVHSGGEWIHDFVTGIQPGLKWTNGGMLMLKKGPARIVLKSADPESDPSNNWSGPVVARFVLTQNLAFVPRREVEYPDGQRVGTAPTGFWFSRDPWAGFTRFSAPGSFYYTPYAPVKWETLPESEINPTEYAFEIRNGEVDSRLFVLRNNTDEAIGFRPILRTGDIPSTVRVVAGTLTGGGFWSPMLLLRREELTAPPRQNTGLWLTFDCRDVNEGVYKGMLEVAGNRIALTMTVKGSLEGAPAPYVYPYATPYARQSCWEAFQDLGINMISFCGITKADMKTYGIAHQVGIRASADTEDRVHAGIDMAEAQGLAPGDYSWYLIDEPGPSKYARWLEMARNVRKVDPGQWIWCNLGEGPPSKDKLSTMLEMMDYWDVSCPYFMQFGANRKDPAYDAYVEKLRNVGTLRLLYETPCIGDNEKLFWAPTAILRVAERAQRHNRNGWAFFSLKYGAPYDDVYTANRDFAVSIYPGSRGATIHTRNSEAVRESIQRWQRAKRDETTNN